LIIATGNRYLSTLNRIERNSIKATFERSRGQAKLVMGLGVNGRPPDSRAKDREGGGMNRSECDEPLQADVRKPN